MESEITNDAVATDEAEEQLQAPGEPAPSSAEIVAERDRLAKEKNELQDLLQRRQAEFENYRRRVERERGELLEFASMDTVKATAHPRRFRTRVENGGRGQRVRPRYGVDLSAAL